MVGNLLLYFCNSGLCTKIHYTRSLSRLPTPLPPPHRPLQVLIAYRLKRRAFRDKERAGEMGQDFSDYTTRDRDYSGGVSLSGKRKGKRKAKPITGREWTPDDRL